MVIAGRAGAEATVICIRLAGCRLRPRARKLRKGQATLRSKQ